jgi:hypothetical protein
MKNRLRYLICRGGLFLIFFLLLAKPASAQHLMVGNDNNLHIEIGVNLGPTFFLGDLGGHRGYGTTFIKDLNLPLTKPMMGLFLGLYPNEWIGLRLAGQYTYLEGKDAIISTNGTNESFRKFRNLDFKSDVWEAYTAVELYPFMLLNRDDDNYQPALRPYFFAGIGYFHFNPQGSLTDVNGDKSWYYLQPLHTEGEGFAEYPDRKPYSLTQLNIPMGAGLKYLLNENLSIGTELLYRKTFTDYIDDVSTTYIDPNLFNKYLSVADANIAMQIHDKSAGTYTRTDPGLQRGNPKNNDAYFSFLFKLGFRLGSNSDTRATNQSRCPARF